MNYYIRKSSAGSWNELPVTGKSIVWAAGETQARDATDVRKLTASGMFEAGSDVDARLLTNAAGEAIGLIGAGGQTMNVVTASADPLTGSA